MPKPSSPAMQARNKLGSLILQKAPEEEIQKQRQELLMITLEPHIRAALEGGITAGKIAYRAKQLAGDAK